MQITGKTALITGAGSGIGRETALAFAHQGAQLILSDIQQGSLDETAALIRAFAPEAVLMTYIADVSDRAAMQAFAAQVHAQFGAVDILVNNAGVGLAGGLIDTSYEDFDWVLGINLWGVIHGCKEFIPAMIRRKQGGHVVNVASAAGYYATAGMMGYNTSKFGVFGFTESLREDLRPFGIGVSTICPGVVNTNIIKQTRMAGNSEAEQAEIREKVDQIYVKRNYGPEKVAAAIVSAVTGNRGILPVTPEAWFLFIMNRISPRFTHWLVGRIERSQAPDAIGSAHKLQEYRRD
tara:strand:+ start:4484 stop:5362 length:879 start_codon:yes stop_codon:yes gene_type:complete